MPLVHAGMLEAHLVRELEVPGGDRHPVAPASLLTYAVDDRDGLLPDDLCVETRFAQVRPARS